MRISRLCLICSLFQGFLSDPSIEYNITKTILSTFNKELMPNNLTIKISITLNQIVLIDERSQILTTNSIVKFFWVDERFRFLPMGSVKEFYISSSLMWLPDLSVINAVNHVKLPLSVENLVRVNYKGEVMIVINLNNLKTHCLMDYYKFPYDVQYCNIVLGSWQLDSSRININIMESKIDASKVLRNNYWILNNVSTSATNPADRFSPDSQGNDIVYGLTLKRRPVNFMICNIFPVFIVNGVTLLAFLFPYPQQCIVTTSCFLALGIYSLRISDSFSSESHVVPLVNIHLMLGILYTFLSLSWFVCCEQLRLKKKLPICLENCLNLLFMCYRKDYAISHTPEVVAKDDLCFKCKSCSQCEIEKKSEHDKLYKLKRKMSQIKDLNFCILSLMALLYFLTYLVIWILIIT